MATPLGPAPINRLPHGLLDLLDIKSMGQTPQAMVPALQPVLELFRWYADSNALEVFFTVPDIVADASSVSGLITATGPVDLSSPTGVLVPPGELWIMLEANTAWAITDAGGIFDMAYNIVAQPAGLAWLLPMGAVQGFTTGSAGIVRTGRRCLERPFILRPGSNINYIHFGAEVGAGQIQSINGRMRLLRLRI